MPTMIIEMNRLLPVFETPAHLELYDIEHAAYDVQLSITTLAGLINRGRPRVYLLANNDAASLFDALLTHVPHVFVALDGVDILDAMLKTYRDSVKGMVIYDPDLPDSVNVATTLAGLRDAIIVSPPQAATLQQKPYRLPVVSDLRVHHWRSRLQAYRWAQRNLLKETTMQLVASLDPGIAGALRSYLVATRAFVYWLNPLNLLPDPTSGWTSERCLMKRIIRAYPPGTSHLGWFPRELAGVDMTSKAGLYLHPSDFLNNLEVWSAVEPSENYIENAKDESNGETRAAIWTNLPRTTINDSAPHIPIYLSFTISDGDNLQYDQHRMYRLWQDGARGSIPLGWTISPALIEAAPALAAYYRSTATHNDELIAGPSGAAYMWPSRWPAHRLGAFLQVTGELMQRMNLRTVQVLDGPLSQLFPYRSWQQHYARSLLPFGVRGMLLNGSYRHSGWRVVAGMPVIKNLGLAQSVAQALTLIKSNTPAQLQNPTFLNVYIFAWRMTPTDIRKVIQSLDDRYKVVTPGQLCALIARMREQA